MANEPEVSKNGVFWDTENRKVVNKEPAQGVQLVAPGTEVTADAQAVIDAYKAAPLEEAAEVETVETATVKAAGKRR